MDKYKVRIDIEALTDIREAYSWYEEQSKDLGKRYKSQVISQINTLKKNPYLFSIKYNDIHCLKIKKFPFLVHFNIKENTVNVFAVLHTSMNPKIWEKRIK